MLRDSHESLETQRQYIRLADAWAMGHGQRQLLEEYAQLREYLWNLRNVSRGFGQELAEISVVN